MEYNDLTDILFEKFKRLVYKHAGISLSDSKRQLLRSRLQRRVRALGLSGYQAYYELVSASAHDSEEVVEFINAVTTNKTDFLRERHHFEHAVQVALPDMRRRGEVSLKIWHAGCSTGEEPYTLAMYLCQEQEKHSFTFRQLATDIDTQVLEHSKCGIYDEDRILPLSSEWQRKWLQKGKGHNAGKYRVKPLLQENVVFDRLNLVEFPWPIRAAHQFDVIFCRNVLIYFDRETQHKIIEGFLERLRPGGYLYLGHSESIHSLQDHLESLGKTIYRSKGSSFRKAA